MRRRVLARRRRWRAHILRGHRGGQAAADHRNRNDGLADLGGGNDAAAHQQQHLQLPRRCRLVRGPSLNQNRVCSKPAVARGALASRLVNAGRTWLCCCLRHDVLPHFLININNVVHERRRRCDVEVFMGCDELFSSPGRLGGRASGAEIAQVARVNHHVRSSSRSNAVKAPRFVRAAATRSIST